MIKNTPIYALPGYKGWKELFGEVRESFERFYDTIITEEIKDHPDYFTRTNKLIS